MIYDFTKGVTAEYLLNKLKARFVTESDFEYKRLDGIHHEKINLVNGSYIYREGENEYYMFAYLKRYATKEYDDLPRYHITSCPNLQTYTGYSFANEMPVEIYCKDQHRDIGKKNLDLCKDCHNEINYFSLGDAETNWFDVILKKAENRNYKQEDRRRDCYTKDWKQISKAYRYKKGFICEVCGIDLSNKSYQYFCEVHHKNKKTDNSLEDLECLCIKCHSEKDKTHIENYSSGNNKKKLNLFKELVLGKKQTLKQKYM